MKQPIWTRSYEVSSFLSNPQKKLGLVSLLNLLQDAAWLHATHLGHGYEAMLRKKALWVLTRQKAVMDEWPEWGSKVEIVTWVRPFSGPYADRDFEIRLDGRKIGEATTSWIILDLESRRPLKTAAGTFEVEVRPDGPVTLAAPKIPLREDLEDLAAFRVRNSDLDMNDHVNNTRYAQWILDSIPAEWHRRYRLREYEVCFLAETHAGDDVTIRMSPPSADPASGPFWTQFQGFRENDGRTVFSARLKTETVPGP